jgi:glucose/arabinose dehydrogenase/cytochrome c5
MTNPRGALFAGLLCCGLRALAGDVGEPATPALADVSQPPAYQGELATLAALNIRNGRIDRITGELVRPWAMEFLSPGELLVSEIGGRLVRLVLDGATLHPIAGVPAVATAHDQTGLLDVALHPQFAQNRWIYFSYVESDSESGRYYRTVVDRARLVGDSLEGRERLLSVEPFLWSPSNFGGALAFATDGHLYVSVGDRSESEFAQDGQRLQGKILRLTDDGGVPADNPFVGDERIDDRIWALGVRNPQGLDVDSRSGLLYEAEHGPMGGDEVNLIERGRNYGWPTITYGVEYTTAPIGTGTHREGFEQPLFYYLPSEAISPLLVYRGAMFPEWEGDLLVGALKGQHVSRLDLDGGQVRSEYPILREIGDRIRDLKAAADGSLFVLTQSRGLFRLWRRPEPPAPETDSFDAGQLYQYVCAGCHDSGAYRAPRPGVPEQRQALLDKPRDSVYANVINGLGAMPARGLCHFCSDQQLRLTVDYMLDRSAPQQPETGR